MTAEQILNEVLGEIDGTLDGMCARPRMYGNAQILEFQFLTLLNLKAIALGRGNEFQTTQDLIHNRWMSFVDEVYKAGPHSLFLSGREEWCGDLVDFVGYFKTFQERLRL